MILIIWYTLMLALLWSVFYRSAMADKRTKFCIRLGLTGTAAGALLGCVAPLYGWVPDVVTTAIVVCVVNMQIVFARFWKHHVPSQYIREEFKILRRSTDFGDTQIRELT